MVETYYLTGHLESFLSKKMIDQKYLIIGDFGYAIKKIGGQTIKTRNIYDVLKEHHNIIFYDTGEIKKNKLNVFKLFWQAYRYKNVFFIGGKKNLKYFFPLLFLISKAKRGNIVYVTVGGWLYSFLKSSPFYYTYMLKNISSILVETNYLEEKLTGLGLNNVSWIPNFRITPHYKLPENKANTDTLKFVFMARVTKQKGIYLLFDFIDQYLKSLTSYGKKITIDFYGPISADDEAEFKKLVNKYSSHVNYKGILEPSEIYQILPHYDVLILPTFHEGEGFPGTILDAYLCGLPVITTRWKQLPEFVEEGKTGFLIDYDVKQLANKIQLLASDAKLLVKMKSNAYEKSKQYSEKVGLEVLERAMGL